jgi:hypothetical protein
MKSTKELLKKYESLRTMDTDLNHIIMRFVQTQQFKGAAKKLGLLKSKTLYIQNETETDIFMNYLLYHYPHLEGKKNAIEIYAATNLDKYNEEEQQFILAKAKAEYAILLFEKTTKHGGIIVRNLLDSAREELLIDKWMSITCKKGFGIATSIIRLPEFIMTTGSGIPMTPKMSFDSLTFINKYDNFSSESFSSFPKKEQAKFITHICKQAIANDIGNNVNFNDPLDAKI